MYFITVQVCNQFIIQIIHSRYVGPGDIHPSYTVIDGNFVSLFQYQEGSEVFLTLSRVLDTPLGTCTNSKKMINIPIIRQTAFYS